jgi:hypothetical protein
MAVKICTIFAGNAKNVCSKRHTFLEGEMRKDAGQVAGAVAICFDK